jgi:hypothetical protein
MQEGKKEVQTECEPNNNVNVNAMGNGQCSVHVKQQRAEERGESTAEAHSQPN